MYTLQLVSDTQQAHWDQFVNDHPRGHFLQSWGWGDLKAGSGWQPLRLALWHTARQEMAASAQVLCYGAPRLPLRLGYLAYIPRGPVIDWAQPDLCRAFFTQLDTFLRRHGAVALRMEPPLEVAVAADDRLQESMSAMPCYPTTPVQPVRTFMLDLAPEPPVLLASMKEKWRYNVRLAERKGVTIREAAHIDDVRAWYGLLRATSERDQFGIHILDYYLRCWRIFTPRRQLRLFLAEHDGQLLAGILVAFFARQAIYLYGASSSEQRHLMPNYLLQWHAILQAREQGAATYDFWGIPATDEDDEPMAGVYRFKRGWGGRIVRFAGCYEHVYRPLAMRLARSLI